MRLNKGTIHQNYVIQSIRLPLQLQRRLESLGLLAGTAISIQDKKKNGAMVVKFRGTRFAFGRGITDHIEVEEQQR